MNLPGSLYSKKLKLALFRKGPNEFLKENVFYSCQFLRVKKGDVKQNNLGLYTFLWFQVFFIAYMCVYESNRWKVIGIGRDKVNVINNTHLQKMKTTCCKALMMRLLLVVMMMMMMIEVVGFFFNSTSSFAYQQWFPWREKTSYI